MFAATPTDEQIFADNEGVKILLTVIACLSMFGSIAIIITYFLFENLRTTPRRILVCISIGDFFTVFPYLIFAWHYDDYEYQKYSRNCMVQSFVTTTAVMWSFMWTSYLAFYLYLVVVKNRFELAEKSMVVFHVINWGVPLILVGAAAIKGNVLGSLQAQNSGGWCWIKKQHERWETILWMLEAGKFCEIVSYVVNGILCFKVYRKIKEELEERHQMSDESIEAGKQGQRKLAWAPILFVVLRIWGTIRFFMYSFQAPSDNTVDYPLLILHIIGDSSQGCVNFILFCLFTKKVRENLRRMCCCKESSAGPEHTSLIANKNQSIVEHKYIFQEPKGLVYEPMF